MSIFSPANVGIIGLDPVAAEGFNPESNGASPDASAALNATAIQASLSAAEASSVGGDVMLVTPGTYLINNTLTIGTRTRFYVGPGVTIKQTAGINKNLLVTRGYTNYTTAPVTITISWSSGFLATVTWTNHGLTNNDYVLISGANQTEYNFVHPVYDVLTANTFRIYLSRLPTAAATGTIVAAKCTTDFWIGGGGTFDYDYTNNPSAVDTKAFSIILGCAARFTVDGLRSVNAFKYCLNIGGAANYRVNDFYGEGIQGSSSSEGLKHYGPINNGKITNISCRTSDDGMSIQTREPAAFASYRWTFGDITNLEVDGAQMVTSAGAMACGVYLSDSEIVDNIVLRRVCAKAAGASESGIVVKYGNTFSTGQAGRIIIEDPYAQAETAASQYGINVSANVRNLILRSSRNVNASNTAIHYRQTGGTVGSLRVEGFSDDNTNWPSSSQYHFSISDAGTTCNSIHFSNAYMKNSTSFGRILSIGGATCNIHVVTFDNCVFDGQGVPVFVQASAATVPIINFNGCYINGNNTGGFVTCDSTCVVKYTGCQVPQQNTFGLLRVNNAAAHPQLYSGGGNKLGASVTWFTTAAGDCEVYGWDIRLDPLSPPGTLATTAGQYCYSTNATANKQGPSVRAASLGQWVALGTGVGGVNTPI